MRTAFLTSIVAAASLVSAAPLAKRQTPDIDAIILQYALTLEHLEAFFYKEGLSKFDANAFKNAGYPTWVRERVTEIASHEANHVKFLSTALQGAGVTPTAACEYKFPYSDPAGFLAVSQILEGVGTSAYLGAAANITNPAYLTAAGSILTVEARHTAWIRSAANLGDAFPAPYETPLDFNQTYSLAAAFITSCPSSNPTLPVTAFPTLKLTTEGKLSPGQEICFEYKNQKDGDYVVFLHELNQYPVQLKNGKANIPKDIYGQIYAVVTSSDGTVSDDSTLAGPAVVEVPLPNRNFNY